jgi:(p)ppGpp synthase/HD superfamily hydrolase
MDTTLTGLTARFDSALSFAARLHSQQVRKAVAGTNPVPYIAHLLAVSALVLENGGSEDEAIAALLHDAIEDQGGAAAEEVINICFGHDVAAIVRGCTDADVIPKPDWWTRKRIYLDHLKSASPSVRLVSACDKLHNARAILTDYRTHGPALWAIFKTGKEGTLWYYRSLADEYLRAGPVSVGSMVDGVVSELEREVRLSSDNE